MAEDQIALKTFKTITNTVPKAPQTWRHQEEWVSIIPKIGRRRSVTEACYLKENLYKVKRLAA